MYKALVRSHLDYCDVIYHILSIIHQPPVGMTLNSLMEKVERIQYQIHKMVNNSTLSYLKDKLPPYCREMFSGNICTTFHAII